VTVPGAAVGVVGEVEEDVVPPAVDVDESEDPLVVDECVVLGIVGFVGGFFCSLPFATSFFSLPFASPFSFVSFSFSFSGALANFTGR
jgi:hypothetical protein